MIGRGRRGAILPAAVFLILMVASPVLASVADYVARPVISVRMTFEGHEDRNSRLLDLIMTRVGAPLSVADVRETVTHLMSLGEFQDVRVHASRMGAGVGLVYQLIPLQRVGHVRFDGDLGLSKRTLRTAVTDRYGMLPPLGRADAAARTLTDLYHRHGYLRADVTPREVTTNDPELVTLAFEIKAGMRARIRSIRIVGKPLRPAPAVIEDLGLHPGDAYDSGDIQERLLRYANHLRGQGYYEARLVPSITIGEQRETVALTIAVSPGPHVTVVFQGDPLPVKQRSTLVPIRQEGSVDEDLLEDSTHSIRDYFRAQGYRDATASFRREIEGNELKIIFQIHRGALYRIAAVQTVGDGRAPLSSLPPDLRLRAGDPFVQARLDAAVATLRLRYHQLGYGDVRITPTVTIGRVGGGSHTVDDPRAVGIRIVVHEGIRTIVDDVAIVGNHAIPEATLRGRLLTVPGRPLYGPDVARDRDMLQQMYLDRGFESATVTPQLGFNASRSRVAVRYVIQQGPQIFIDHVLIVGNTRTSTKLIERTLTIKPGQPLNLKAINESQRRLVALGLFRRVRIEELRHGSDIHRDVLVSVEEAPTTTIGYGGGVEVGLRPLPSGQTGFAVDRLEFAPRALFEITRRNLFGKDRSISLFSRVSLRPNAAPFVAGAPASETGYGFSDYRVIGTYREPRLFGTSADLLVTGVLEQGVRASFNFAHRGFSAQVARRLSRTLSITGNYAIDRNRVFDEQVSPADQLLIDRLFPQVRLSSFSTAFVRDTRDDPINPTHGGLMVLNAQVAGRAIGSEVGFAKAFIQDSIYRTVPGWGRVVFAADARLGLATGFPRNVPETNSQGQPVLGPNGQPVLVQVRDLPASERFFAGGDTTVRGFALDQLGTPATIDANGFAQGGDALVILNAELRVPVWHAIGVVGFVDAGNVWAHVGDLNPAQIRVAVGFGLRYQSPIGPIRIDLGFKLQRRELVPGHLEPLTALNISFGQAF